MRAKAITSKQFPFVAAMIREGITHAEIARRFKVDDTTISRVWVRVCEFDFHEAKFRLLGHKSIPYFVGEDIHYKQPKAEDLTGWEAEQFNKL